GKSRMGAGGQRRRPAGGVASDVPYVVASPQLAASPLLLGHTASVPRREALILQSVVNHPWLAHDHLEELAGLEFRHSDAQRLKAVLLDPLDHGLDADSDRLRAMLVEKGHGSLLARIEQTITTPGVWGARPQAAPDDVLMTWKQLIALHR